MTEDQRKRKIDALNSLEVVEWSALFGELEYVLAKNNEENRQTLLDAGFTQEQIKEATDSTDENDIDLVLLAVNYADIYCWHKDKGFIEENELAVLVKER